jgi:hypothetical protein
MMNLLPSKRYQTAVAVPSGAVVIRGKVAF